MSVERILGPSNVKPATEKEALRESVEELIMAVQTLISVFEKAKSEIKAEPTQQVLMKLDELTIYNKQMIEQNREVLQQTAKVLQQNKDMAHSLLMLLDLHREHLPEIAKHTRMTSEVRRAPLQFSRTRPSRMPPMPRHDEDEQQAGNMTHP